LFGLKGVKFYEVISRSMEPTLSVGDRIIAIKPENLKRKDSGEKRECLYK